MCGTTGHATLHYVSYLFPRPLHLAAAAGLIRRAEPSPLGRVFPRRPHDNFILRTAPCSVLTVRRAEHEFVEGLGTAGPSLDAASDTERR